MLYLDIERYKFIDRRSINLRSMNVSKRIPLERDSLEELIQLLKEGREPIEETKNVLNSKLAFNQLYIYTSRGTTTLGHVALLGRNVKCLKYLLTHIPEGLAPLAVCMAISTEKSNTHREVASTTLFASILASCNTELIDLVLSLECAPILCSIYVNLLEFGILAPPIQFIVDSKLDTEDKIRIVKRMSELYPEGATAKNTDEEELLEFCKYAGGKAYDRILDVIEMPKTKSALKSSDIS